MEFNRLGFISNREDVCDVKSATWQPSTKRGHKSEELDADQIIEAFDKYYTSAILSITHKSLQQSIVDIQKAIKQLKKRVESKNIYIQNLRHPNYILKSPLSVTFEYENDLCVANCYDIGMYGQGDTEEEAIDDLCEVIVEYYESLKDDESRLGPLPTKHWLYLKRIIEKK